MELDIIALSYSLNSMIVLEKDSFRDPGANNHTIVVQVDPTAREDTVIKLQRPPYEAESITTLALEDL